MLFLLSSLSLSFADDVCSEINCSILNHISNFSVDEANERWNMIPRQTRASTYRYISQLQTTDAILEDSQWTPLYWQKYLQTDDLREKMAALELIHRSHKSQIRNGVSSTLLSRQQIQEEISQVFKEEPSKRDILLMALMECSQILSIVDQISLHRWLISYYSVVDVSPLSAQALRNIDIVKLNDEQRDGVQNLISEMLIQSNQPAELIRAADWLQLYEVATQDAVLKKIEDNKVIDSEVYLRGLRYFEHCNIAKAQSLIGAYDLQKSTDNRVQRLAEKIMTPK